MRALVLLARAGAAAAAAGNPSQMAPAGFDCKTRHLAMEYAQKIQPFRSKADFEVLAEVLDMHGGSPGGEAQCFNVTAPADAPESFAPTFPIPASGTVVYADSANGKDSNAGTMAAPFETIGAALAATRKAKGGGATIVLRKGVYTGEQALNLTAADSGLTIQNYNGEEAWLSGAKKLNTKWTAGGGDHPRFGQANFDAKSVWKADLSGQGVKVIEGLRIAQERAVRARYPNGCTPCSGDSCKPLPSNYLCQGFQNGTRVVDPNDGCKCNRYFASPFGRLKKKRLHSRLKPCAVGRLDGEPGLDQADATDHAPEGVERGQPAHAAAQDGRELPDLPARHRRLLRQRRHERRRGVHASRWILVRKRLHGRCAKAAGLHQPLAARLPLVSAATGRLGLRLVPTLTVDRCCEQQPDHPAQLALQRPAHWHCSSVAPRPLGVLDVRVRR